jgi:hypothetical protein
MVELKEYRGDLSAVLRSAAPNELLLDGTVDRAYILDGIDEVPTELLTAFAHDLDNLAETDVRCTLLATARQAFYVTYRRLFAKLSAVFHILDFADQDIRQYVALSRIPFDAFREAANKVDLQEELANPFVLLILVERFKATRQLSDHRSEMMSAVIHQLILSRPRIDAHRQRRALCMLAVALEVYSRNELTEGEALQVIRASMRISEHDARELLNELYASILRRTANGLAFQMRSYGEYLAAEELEREKLDRVRELAFLDHNTPNDSWMNAISYLVELNPSVRAFFVRKFPFWVIQSSPAVFTEDERTTVASGILQEFRQQRQYLRIDSRVRLRYLGRFLTPAVEEGLRRDLDSRDEVLCGNALVLLGVLKRPETLPIALPIVKDQTRGVAIRHCAIIAIVNAGSAAHVPELLAALTDGDPIRNNVVDAIGALADLAQLPKVLPLVLRAPAMLTATYFHFRELRSREALLAVMLLLVREPQGFDTIHAKGYLEPILFTLPEYFDSQIAELCFEILQVLSDQNIYADRNGPLRVMLTQLCVADKHGQVARLFFERQLQEGGRRRPPFHTVQILASIATLETVDWLIQSGATDIIKELARFVGGPVREALRPHSGGTIDAQDANANHYREENERAERQRKSRVHSLQESLFTRKTLADALVTLQELTEGNWPELPETFKHWLADEIGALLAKLDLEHSIRWEGNTLWLPNVLPSVLRLISRYELPVVPDEMMVFPAMGMDEQVAAKYYHRFGFSEAARRTLERLLATPPSGRALEGLIRFVRETGFSSDTTLAIFRTIATNATQGATVRADAVQILAERGEPNDFFSALRNDPDSAIAGQSFGILIERQDRPTIERALAGLLNNDPMLQAGEGEYSPDSSLSWIGKIRADFAWGKLSRLREHGLRLELNRVTSMLTACLAQIDRSATAKLIRQQLDATPAGWRQHLQSLAIEEERTSRIEKAQRTPFDTVLRKLRGSTSADKLLVVCEGPTDEPVFRFLLGQVADVPEVMFDWVGGWNALVKKDPNSFLRGAKEVIVVMDGDRGRELSKEGMPFTDLAREQEARLRAAGMELRVLERYGIENYFPQKALESVLNKDLSSYFPLPHDVPVVDHLRERNTSPHRPLYSKSRNCEVVTHVDLELDLAGTDLRTVIHEIAEMACRLAAE